MIKLPAGQRARLLDQVRQAIRRVFSACEQSRIIFSRLNARFCSKASVVRLTWVRMRSLRSGWWSGYGELNEVDPENTGRECRHC